MALFTDERFIPSTFTQIQPAPPQESMGESLLRYAKDFASTAYDFTAQPIVSAARNALDNARRNNELERRDFNERFGVESAPESQYTNRILDSALSYLDLRPEEQQQRYSRNYQDMSTEDIQNSLREEAFSDIGEALMAIPLTGVAGKLYKGARALSKAEKGSRITSALNAAKSTAPVLTSKAVGTAALGGYAFSDVANNVVNEDMSIPQAIGDTAHDLSIGNFERAAEEYEAGRPFHAAADVAMGVLIPGHTIREGIPVAKSTVDLVNQARQISPRQAIETGRTLRQESYQAAEQVRQNALERLEAIKNSNSLATRRALAGDIKNFNSLSRGEQLRALQERDVPAYEPGTQSNILNAPFDYLSGLDNLSRKQKNLNQVPYIDTGHPEVDMALAQMAQEEGVPLSYAHAIAEIESTHGENPGTSTAGARGVMQLMPETAKSLGVTDRDNIQENIRGGLRYFKQQLEEFGNPEDAMRAYNAGPGNVEASRGWAETDNYVNRFNELVREYEGQESTTLPESVSNLSSYEMPTQGDRIQEQVNLLPDDFKGAIPTIGGILRDKFGVKGTISSAVRSEEHNAAVGGSPNSYHLQKNGGALDIVFDRDVTKAEIDEMVDYFKSTGAFKEVLYHDVGSGYHLHLGGYEGGLKGSPTTSRAMTSARTSPNASSIPETSQTSQPESIDTTEPSQQGKLTPLTSLEEQYYGPQEKRAQQEELIKSNTENQQLKRESLDKDNTTLTKIAEREAEAKTRNENISGIENQIHDIDTKIQNLEHAQTHVKKFTPPEFKFNEESPSTMDVLLDPKLGMLYDAKKKNAEAQHKVTEQSKFNQALKLDDSYQGLTQQQTLDKIQQELNGLREQRQNLQGNIDTEKAVIDTLVKENEASRNSIGTLPPVNENIFTDKDLSPAGQKAKEILVAAKKNDAETIERELDLAIESGSTIETLGDEHYLTKLARNYNTDDLVTLRNRLFGEEAVAPVTSKTEQQSPVTTSESKTETPVESKTESKEPVYEEEVYDDVFDMIQERPEDASPTDRDVKIKTTEATKGNMFMDDPTRTNTQRIQSELIPKQEHDTPQVVSRTESNVEKKIIPLKSTPSTWEDVVQTVESHYGPVYETNKNEIKRGFANGDDGSVIGIRDRGDIQAIGHEVGHHILWNTMKQSKKGVVYYDIPKAVESEIKKFGKSKREENFADATAQVLSGDFVGLEETRKFLEQDASFRNLQEHINSYNSVDAFERSRRAMNPVDTNNRTPIQKAKDWFVQKFVNDKAPLGILADAQYKKGFIKNKEALDIEAALSTRDVRERLDQLKFGDPDNIKYLETYYETKLNPVTFNSIISHIRSPEFKEFADKHGYKDTAEAFDAYVLANYAEYYRKLSVEQVDAAIDSVTNDLQKVNISEKIKDEVAPVSAEEAILRSDYLRNSFGDEVYRAFNRAFNERSGNSRKVIYDRFFELLREQRDRYISDYKTVIDIPTARKIIDAAPKSAEEALKDFQQVIDNYYRIATHEGVISKEAYKRMSDNSDFFPQLKNFSDIQDLSLPESLSVKEYSQVPKFDYRQPVQSPLTTVESTLDRLGRDTEKNRVLKIFLKGTSEQVGDKVVNKMPEFFREVNKPGKNTLTLYENGKPRHWQCHDDLIYHAIESGFLKPQVTDSIVQKALQMPARLLRFTATNTAGFVLSNFVRDTGTAFMQGKGYFPPVADSIRAAKTLAKGLFGVKDADYRQLEASGFFGSSIYKEVGREDTLMDRYARGQFIERLKRNDIRGAAKSLVANAQRATDIIERVGTHVESFNRAAAFFHELNGIENITKKDLQRARLASQDISVDFSRGGEWSKEANKYIPFLNASIQGVYNFYRAANRNPKEFAIKALTIGAISTAYALSVSNSSWYKNETEDTKRRNWLFRIGNTTVKIPKPYELGAICNIMEHGAEVFSRKKSPAAALYAIGGDLNEALMPGTMPQGMSLVLGLAAGYDSFYGKQIDSPYNKSYKNSIARDANSWLSKKVGKQVSPIPELSDNQSDWLLRSTLNIDSRKGNNIVSAAANSYLNPTSRFISNEKYTQNQQDYYNRRAYLQQQKQDGNLTRQEQRDYDLIKKVDADLKKAKTTQQKQVVIDKAMRVLGR